MDRMNSIRFHNTLKGGIEAFVPLHPGEVRMYACGPTVYDFAHIGNFRTFVFEDLLRRFLEFSGYEVTHVMNITDVDDKTIAGAQREGKQLAEYTAVYTQAFNEDLKTLNCLAPSLQPCATENIQLMIDLISRLMEKGAAYESDGSIYFRVSKFPGYGKLSKKKLEMNIAGASERVDVDEYEKEEASDFVLWKKSKEEEPGWQSPWGAGRPGWHIECSAMSVQYLGETFDIHAGGEDLIFPHHENEIAQSEAATEKPFVRYWLHAKHLLADGEKMSKSKGNFYTLRDLISKGYDPMAIRYVLLSVHYRQQLNFTLEHLKEAGEVIKRLDDCYWQCVSRLKGPEKQGVDASYFERILSGNINEICKWLGDDLNISGVLAELSDAVTEMNKTMVNMDHASLELCVGFFKKIDKLLGFNIAPDTQIPDEINALMQERAEVRSRVKDDKSLWAKSDELRNRIQTLGWVVKDGKPGELSTVKEKRRAWD